MSDFPTQNITIYHKNNQNLYERYTKEASIRNTSMLNRDKYGFSENDKLLVRVFDVEGYNNSVKIKNNSSVLNCPLNSFLGSNWKVQLGDIIVNGTVEDDIKTTTPHTELSKKYGKDNVFKVNSINVLIFNDEDIEEINHIKLGCI